MSSQVSLDSEYSDFFQTFILRQPRFNPPLHLLKKKMIASTPSPPYYAVIFSNIRSDVEKGYAETAQLMLELAEQQPGYLGHESVRDGLGITISYWKDLESIRLWKSQSDHQLAQQMGRDQWYTSYKTRICRVERDYGFEADQKE